jgi:hypothetical protein
MHQNRHDAQERHAAVQKRPEEAKSVVIKLALSQIREGDQAAIGIIS